MKYLGSIYILLYSFGAVICCKESDLQFWVSDVEGFPQQKNFFKQGCLSPSSDSSGSHITVDLNKHHQKMLGFGAAMTHSSAYLIFNSPHRNQIMESLFSSSKGAGINVIRMPIDGSDFVPNQPYTYADSGNINDFSINKDKQYMIPILKQALSLNPHLEIIASPWSAPAWMKWAPYWNNQRSSLNGGSFNMKYADTYATYLVKFIQAYQHEGVNIYAMTIQNEPGFEADGYPTMKLGAPDERDFVKVLGPKFASANIHTKIIIYDHNWDHPEYPISVLNDHTAKRYISGSAFHCYGGDRKSPAQVVNAHPDRDIYFTECTGSGSDTTWKRVFRWNFVNLFVGQPRVFARTVLLWNLALDENHGPVLTTPGCSRGCGCKDCRGVVTVRNDKSGFDKNIEYYIIQHFTKFVHRNAIRLESTSDLGDGGTLHSVAFKNPNGDIILIVINDSWTSKQTFRVTIGRHTYKYTDIPTEGAVVFRISEAGSTIIG
ncbi:uncharacterized protein LOC126823592 [Patella vulgata]|uniref:uncharacterized protein LOC126823592 n=1 Tax=Patella vulgata TaxID=6465 RepID=UPI0024A8CFAA|nr:uncharacterized protein LOC126823592 [Patella vulgata]